MKKFSDDMKDTPSQMKLFNKLSQDLYESRGKFENKLYELDILPILTLWSNETKTKTNDFDLMSETLINFINKFGYLKTIGELRSGGFHLIIEEIRTNSKLDRSIQEKIVANIISFFSFLHEKTLGIFQLPYDPDKQQCAFRKLNYELFVEFSLLLPERESLLAKVLYFGAPTLDEVLNLKWHQVSNNMSCINFQKHLIKYPRHIIDNLINLKTRKGYKDNELVFQTSHGDYIKRNHLISYFDRACRKLKTYTKITPKVLLETMPVFINISQRVI